MKYISIDFQGKISNKEPFFSNGTSLVDELDVSYQKLIKTFGKPNSKGDNYKVDAEWVVFTPSGVATIYNYKTGKNYLGKEGKKTEDIRDWHIGGKSKEVVKWIKKALEVQK